MTKEQMKLIENIKPIYEGVTLFMMSSGVLDLMYNKVANGADPLVLLNIDKEHLKTRESLLGTNGTQMLETIVNDYELSVKLLQIMDDVAQANKKMTRLLKQVEN